MAIPAAQARAAAILRALAGAGPLETHISAVFRGPDSVWKLKKSVRLAFLDFTSVDDRRRLLEREVALNAPHAPGLYRDVVPVIDAGRTIDWALRMARVPDADFLDRMAQEGGLDAPLLAALADGVAAMHAAQPRVADTDPARRMQAVAAGNARAAVAAGLGGEGVRAWEAAVTAALSAAAPLLDARGPLVRRAHGDLHLGNLLLWHGRPVPFDALEFDEALATIDPGYDLAFLLMDLDQRVSRGAANAVLNRYVARTGDVGLVGPLAAFLSLRAMVRAHVEASCGRDGAGLVAAALAYLQPARPVVVAIGGLMGAGKSSLARALAPTLGRAPGALVLRSDEIRKRLHGVAPKARLPQSAYGPRGNAGTNQALVDGTGAAARGGHAVIADSTFLDPGLRAAVAAGAAAAGVRFLGVWLDAPMAELERRVAARTHDASDATVAVLRAAAAGARPPADWLRLDATNLGSAQAHVQSAIRML